MANPPRRTPPGGAPIGAAPGRAAADSDPGDLLDQGAPATMDLQALSRAVHRLWPCRRCPDQILELESRLAQLEAQAGGAAPVAAVEQLRIDLVDLSGASGDDGKLGELRRGVEKLEDLVSKHALKIESLSSFRWQIIGATTFAGLLAGLAVSIVSKLL